MVKFREVIRVLHNGGQLGDGVDDALARLELLRQVVTHRNLLQSLFDFADDGEELLRDRLVEFHVLSDIGGVFLCGGAELLEFVELLQCADFPQMLRMDLLQEEQEVGGVGLECGQDRQEALQVLCQRQTVLLQTIQQQFARID